LDFKQYIGASGITWSSKGLTLMQNCIQISGALDFKQHIGASDSPFGVLVEVQAARKLAVMYGFIVAA